MEEQSKKEALAKLYTLRAGLSVISQKKDAVTQTLQSRDCSLRALEEENVSLNKERAAAKKKLNEIKHEIDFQAKPECEDREKSDLHILTCKRQVERSNQELKSAKRETAIHIFFLVLFFAAAVVCGIIYAVNRQTSLLICTIVFACLTVISPYGIIIMIDELSMCWDAEGFFLFFRPWLIYEDVDMGLAKRSVERSETTLKEAEARFESMKASQPTFVTRIHEIENSLAEKKNDAKAVQVQAEKKSQPFLEQSGVIDRALVDNFSEFLDPRDWKYLDLIIFYLETGRADSIKEALQQVDREAQTDRIVGAVQTAGENITQSIESGLASLKSGMVQCFSVLSEQIAQSAEQQMIGLAMVSGQMQKLSGQLGDLSQQVQSGMQAALKEKSSSPSSQLMDDVRYMRTLAENAEIRRRNAPV